MPSTSGLGSTLLKIPFEIRSSHFVNIPGYRRESHPIYPYDKSDFPSDLIKDVYVNGYLISELAVNAVSGGIKNYGHHSCELTAEISGVLSRDVAIEIISSLRTILSAYWIKHARNPHSGLPVIDYDWRRFIHNIKPSHATPVETASSQVKINEQLGFISHVGTAGEEPVQRLSDELKSVQSNVITELLVSGANANLSQSKFLMWFAILESFVEARDSPVDSQLYNEGEQLKIRSFAGQFEGAKRTTILSVLRKTAEPRAYKLYTRLLALGLSEITGCFGRREVTLKMCTNLIEARNKIAHRGRLVDDDLLFGSLLPICIKITEIKDFDLTHKQDPHSRSPNVFRKVWQQLKNIFYRFQFHRRSSNN